MQATPMAGTAPRPRKRRRQLPESVFGILLVAPLVLWVLAVLAYPLFSTVWISLRNQAMVGTNSQFVGLQNYQQLLADQLFWGSFQQSVIWTLGNGVVQTLMGLAAAFLLRYPLQRIKAFQSGVILPWIIPTVVMALMWRWMLAPSYGIVGYLLVKIGLFQQAPNLLGSPAGAMPTLIFLNSWRWFPFIAIMIYASLQNIPKDEYDAADLEGASTLQQHRFITMPYLAPTMFVLGLVGTMLSFNVFDVIYLITKGGPLTVTTTLPVLVYKTAFENFRMSKAAAQSVSMFLMLVAFVVIYYGGGRLTNLFARLISRLRTHLTSDVAAAQQVPPQASLERRAEWARSRRVGRRSPLATFPGRVFTWVLVSAMGLLILVPFYWVLLSSFRHQQDLYTKAPSLVPSGLSLDNYRYLLTRSDYLIYLKNSTIVAAVSVVITALLALHAAYGLSRFRFPGRSVLHKVVLLAYLLPPVVILVPLFQVMKGLGLINSLGSLVVTNVALAAPFATWLMANFLEQVPREVEEAALLEGTSRLGVLYRVVMPLLAPGLASVVMFALISAWSEYTFAITFLMDSKLMTLPAGLSLFLSTYNINWPVVSAAAVATAIPIVLFFVVFGPAFIRNMTQGSVK